MVDRIGISKLINWTVWHRMARGRERARAFDERERQWIYECVFHLWPIHFRLKACSVSNKIHLTPTFLSTFLAAMHAQIALFCRLLSQNDTTSLKFIHWYCTYFRSLSPNSFFLLSPAINSFWRFYFLWFASLLPPLTFHSSLFAPILPAKFMLWLLLVRSLTAGWHVNNSNLFQLCATYELYGIGELKQAFSTVCVGGKGHFWSLKM